MSDKYTVIWTRKGSEVYVTSRVHKVANGTEAIDAVKHDAGHDETITIINIFHGWPEEVEE